MIVNENIELTALWIKNGIKTNTLTFDTDGGSNIGRIIVESGKIILLPVNPTKVGYVFAGWIDENGKAVCYYKGENICLTINKETSEITEYICEYGSFLWEETLDAYEIPSGNMIIAKDTIGGKTIDYYNYIKETCDIISFIDIGNYIEGATCKEWYTLDEIKELEPLILDGYLKIIELQKELSKTK